MKVAEAAPPEKKRSRQALRDYSGRSGFPHPAAEMRGIAHAAEHAHDGAGRTEQGGVAGAAGGRRVDDADVAHVGSGVHRGPAVGPEPGAATPQRSELR